MIDDLPCISGHLGGRVPAKRPVALTNAAVVEDETGIGRCVVTMTEMSALRKPVPHWTGETHDPLALRKRRVRIFIEGTFAIKRLLNDGNRNSNPSNSIKVRFDVYVSQRPVSVPLKV